MLPYDSARLLLEIHLKEMRITHIGVCSIPMDTVALFTITKNQGRASSTDKWVKKKRWYAYGSVFQP